MSRYNPKEIEEKWRKRWEKDKTFQVDLKGAKKPFFNLMMFPYPSGEGLHVGHVYAFSGADTFGRLKRAKGYDVFEPMGFDSFGIHSENYAIKVGKHPKDLIAETTKYFREEQLKKLGALFDWEHSVTTSDSDYYRWTQWLFIQLFRAGLAVRKKAPVDWCPACKTVLADEQVIAGKCERCSSEVVQKELEQWFFKITDYAERLLKNLQTNDWSETTKQMQRNWIGRSEGTEIEFPISLSSTDYKPQQKQAVDSSQLAVDKIKVFTTRPDTIFGATFMVLAPEHPIVAELLNSKFKVQSSKLKEIENYVLAAKNKSEVDREKEKTGVFTGLFCINPLTKKEIPIWVADYVLLGYGTGAIMGVPAHDSRDYEFAKKYDLEIIEVISGGNPPAGGEKEAYIGEGKLINSGQFNGIGSLEAIKKVSEYIEKRHLGRKTINYHLRDWLISRQRYWGPPIPMVFCPSCAEEGKSWFTTKEAKEHKILNPKHEVLNKFQIPNSKDSKSLEFRIEAKLGPSDTNLEFAANMVGWYPVPEPDLPVLLPEIKDYRPKGVGASPLAAVSDFINVKCPSCGSQAKRETDVSDTFLDSSWYFLRYPSTRFARAGQVPFDPELTKKWLPVDMYIGGNEHAVLHLLYTRFITMALHDMGYIEFEEPFKKFRAHGLIIHEGAKMSKSRGNVVNPNEYMEAYGADTLRMYLLFIGPYNMGGDFSDRAMTGVYRFLNRTWQFLEEFSGHLAVSANTAVARKINQLVKKVGDDVENLRFNTAIAAIMEFLNFATAHKKEIDPTTLKKFLIVLSIFAPFTSEELWASLGEKHSVHTQPWPEVQDKLLEEEQVIVAVMINGKLRDMMEIQNSKFKNQNELEKKALDLEKIKKHLEGKKVTKTIYVAGKIINFVTS